MADMRIAADSQRNSGAVELLGATTRNALPRLAGADAAEVLFVEPSEMPFGLETEGPSKPTYVGSNVVLWSPGSVYVFSTSGDSVDTLLFQESIPIPTLFHVSVRNLFAQGPPRSSWTVSTWNVKRPATSWLNESLAEIRYVVGSIERREVFQRSVNLKELARKVVLSRQREEDNVEEWASRLAHDVVDAND